MCLHFYFSRLKIHHYPLSLFQTEKAGQRGVVPQQRQVPPRAARPVPGPAQLCPPPAGGTEGHGEQDRRHLPPHRDHVLQT